MFINTFWILWMLFKHMLSISKYSDVLCVLYVLYTVQMFFKPYKCSDVLYMDFSTCILLFNVFKSTLLALAIWQGWQIYCVTHMISFRVPFFYSYCNSITWHASHGCFWEEQQHITSSLNISELFQQTNRPRFAAASSNPALRITFHLPRLPPNKESIAYTESTYEKAIHWGFLRSSLQKT